MAGIEQKFWPIGKSTFFGEYIEGRYGQNTIRSAVPLGAVGNVANSEVTVYGRGFNQQIEAGAMDFYMTYRNYEYDASFPG